MRISAAPTPEVWPTPGAHRRFIELDLCALTPIYKGGSTTEQIDQGCPFRAASIRGGVRYWWRATSTISDVRVLRAREREIFGGVHGDVPCASAVRVGVLDQRSAPGPRPNDKPYAFGVTGQVPEAFRNRQVHEQATGKLCVEWREDEFDTEVNRALEAWLLFGGIGGRSRRGAGSVWWSGGPAVPNSVEGYVDRWRDLVPRRENARWPTLHAGVVLVGPPKATADHAWTEGLLGMQDVRASRGVRPAFARVRDLLEWKRQDYIQFTSGRYFSSSRAALGLPIRFQSSTGTRYELTHSENRYPSPVHLKIVKLGANFHSVLIDCRGPMPAGLRAGRASGSLDARGLNRFLELAARLPGWTRFPFGGAT